MHANNHHHNITATNDVSPYFLWIPVVIRGILMFGLSLITIIGNSIVIYALRTNRHLRTVGNLFILSLATADLVVGCFVMPIAGLYAIMETWHMGLFLCQIWLSVDFTASTASIFNLLTLSLDRYWSITSPLQYLGKRTRARALLLIGLAWGLSLLWVIPIFGWHRIVNNGTRYIDPDKCEPEYTHSKIFKVSTAIINFYLPLIVLISLNARIYFEIKRRYKNVFLQRNPSVISNYQARLSKSYIPRQLTLNLIDNGNKQTYSSKINNTENQNLISSKFSKRNNLTLRINYREIHNHPQTSIQLTNAPEIKLKRVYSFIEKHSCPQNELNWITNHTESPRLSLNSSSMRRANHFVSKYRLNVDERCMKQMRNYNSCEIYSNKQMKSSLSHGETQSHRLSYSKDNHTISDTNHSVSLDQTTMSSKNSSFDLYNCCVGKTKKHNDHANLDFDNDTQRISSASFSSPFSQKPSRFSFYNSQRKNTLSDSKYGPYSYSITRTSNTIRQSTIYNQQEKAFRQLFAIVFGFTCCFTPYFILYMVVAFCGSCVSERAVTITIWFGYVNSTINPFLYALSNEHFRRTFHRIFKRDRRRQSYDS